MYSDDRICTLGVPTGGWKESGKGRLEAWEDPSLSKIGGYAVWHDKESAPRLEDLSCGVCGGHSKVVLVAQVFAPTEDWARSLYLFCCNALDCSQRHEGWTVVRNQRPISQSESAPLEQTTPAPTQAHTQTQTQTPTPTPTPSKSSVWDFLADDNFGNSSSAGDQDLFDLLAMRDLNISSTNNNNNNNKTQQTPAKASKTNNTVTAAAESKRELPFLLTETALPVCKVKESDEDWEAAMDDEELLALPAQGVDAAHIDSLISRYLRDEDDQENLHALHSVGFGQASGGATSSVQIEEDDENEDEEFRREQKNDRKSKTELYFQKRMSVEPKQVLRYAYEGEPLWITSPSPLEGEKAVSVPQCAICGESRVFECQLMPAILSGISRVSKQGGKQKGTGGVEGQARTVRDLFGDELDFGVVAVWSCPNSCCGDASIPCKEFVVVQPPPDAA